MTTNAANKDLWQQILPKLKLQMTQSTFDTWLANSTAECTNGTLVIMAHSTFAKDWLENRLQSIIQRTATRITGHPIQIVFTTKPEQQPSATLRSQQAANTQTSPSPSDPSLLDQDIPLDCRFGIEIVNFDPTTKGWVMTSNYAWQFWQPLLGTVPFNLWNTLRSFPAAFHRNGDNGFQWPSIQTLADICANRNRHAILGRAARAGRNRTVGALEMLEQERIVWTKSYGTGRNVTYYFRVLDNLPLLTPTQVNRLTPRLQERHQRHISRCELDYEEWQQLTLPSLCIQTDMARTQGK